MEFVIGTDPANPDTDGDGVNDGTEIQAGTNPLDNRPAATGVIATVPTPGTARNLVVQDDLALVTLEQDGLAVFNVFNGLSPVLIGLVDTAGSATAVAKDGNRAFVAVGSAGLAVIDLAQPDQPELERQLDVGGSAGAVAAAEGLAYVGVVSDSSSFLAIVDPVQGAVLERIPATAPANLNVHDLAITGDTLWCLTADRLRAYRIAGPTLEFLGESPRLSFFAEGLTDRRRLFVAGGYAYCTSYPGYDVVDGRSPATMELVGQAVDLDVNSFKQLALDAGGMGVAAVGTNPSNDGTHDVHLFAAGNPAVTTNRLAILPTPGITYAVALHKGLAYAADGEAGLQVLNYREPDFSTNPPSLTLRASFSLDPPQAEANRLLWLAADVADDVAVRAVEFWFLAVFSGSRRGRP